MAPVFKARDLGFSPLSEAACLEERFRVEESSGLFIGVSEFNKDPSIVKIPFAVDDAVDLAHAFCLELNLVKPSSANICIAGSPIKQASQARLHALRTAGAIVRDATRTDILLAIAEFSDGAGPDGMMVASVATHGFDAGGESFFATSDFARRDPVDTAIALRKLRHGFERPAKVKRRLQLIDTCRERMEAKDTRRVGGGMSVAFFEELKASEGFATLCATVTGGFSYDDPDSMNGVFTAAILDGIRGGAPLDEAGFLRVGQLASYVDLRVREWFKANNPGSPRTGITRNMEAAAERIPLAFHEGRHRQFSSAREEAKSRAAVEAERRRLEAHLAAEREAKLREEAERRLREEREASARLLEDRISQIREKLIRAAELDERLAEAVPAIKEAMRIWPDHRREILLRSLESLELDKPIDRTYFIEQSWPGLAPDWRSRRPTGLGRNGEASSLADSGTARTSSEGSPFPLPAIESGSGRRARFPLPPLPSLPPLPTAPTSQGGTQESRPRSSNDSSATVGLSERTKASRTGLSSRDPIALARAHPAPIKFVLAAITIVVLLVALAGALASALLGDSPQRNQGMQPGTSPNQINKHGFVQQNLDETDFACAPPANYFAIRSGVLEPATIISYHLFADMRGLDVS